MCRSCGQWQVIVEDFNDGPVAAASAAVDGEEAGKN